MRSKGSGGCSAIHAQTSERGAAKQGTDTVSSRWRHQRGGNNRRRSDSSAKYAPQTQKNITSTFKMSSMSFVTIVKQCGGFRLPSDVFFFCFFCLYFLVQISLVSRTTVEKHTGYEQSSGGYRSFEDVQVANARIFGNSQQSRTNT